MTELIVAFCTFGYPSQTNMLLIHKDGNIFNHTHLHLPKERKVQILMYVHVCLGRKAG